MEAGVAWRRVYVIAVRRVCGACGGMGKHTHILTLKERKKQKADAMIVNTK
jgi:hypothetical protein